MLAAACVYWALPEPLSVGPGWLLLAIIFVLLIPLLVSYHHGRYDVTRILTFTANGAITIAMIASLIFLIQGIPGHRELPTFWCSRSGIGSSTRAVRFSATVIEAAPRARFFFRRC